MIHQRRLFICSTLRHLFQNFDMRKLTIGLLVLSLLASCTKTPGEGGWANIRGRVMKDVRIVITNPATYQYSIPAADQDVYIIYGNHLSPDDRIRTNYLGEFEFRNLRKGDYTVYVYSRDTTGATGVAPRHMPIVRAVQIGDKKETIDLGDLVIYDVP